MTQPQPPVDTPVAELGAIAAALAAAEAVIAAAVLAMYTKWLAEVAAKVLAGFLRFGVAPDPTAVWSVQPLWDQLVDGLMDQLGDIARRGWEDTAIRLGLPLQFDPFDAILADQLSRTRNLMVRTPDEVYRLILRTLDEGVRLSEDNAALAERVRHVLDVTGTENWPARA